MKVLEIYGIGMEILSLEQSGQKHAISSSSSNINNPLFRFIPQSGRVFLTLQLNKLNNATSIFSESHTISVVLGFQVPPHHHLVFNNFTLGSSLPPE